MSHHDIANHNCIITHAAHWYAHILGPWIHPSGYDGAASEKINIALIAHCFVCVLLLGTMPARYQNSTVNWTALITAQLIKCSNILMAKLPVSQPLIKFIFRCLFGAHYKNAHIQAQAATEIETVAPSCLTSSWMPVRCWGNGTYSWVLGLICSDLLWLSQVHHGKGHTVVSPSLIMTVYRPGEFLSCSLSSSLWVGEIFSLCRLWLVRVI